MTSLAYCSDVAALADDQVDPKPEAPQHREQSGRAPKPMERLRTRTEVAAQNALRVDEALIQTGAALFACDSVGPMVPSRLFL